MLSDERKAVLFLAATFRETRWSDNQVTDLEYSANLDLALQNSPNMVHIKFSPLNHSEYFYQLIKRSAYTIESIHAIESKSVLIMGLATGDDGSPIAFPNLKTLKLFNRFEEQHRIVIAGPVAPFMALQRLEISPDNLVDDDALAKISGSAFTCIDMSVDRETLDRLQKHKGFASRKFPQLCHFTVDEDCEPHFRLEPGHFLKYVFGLVAPATQHLEITLEDSYQLIYETIPTYPSLQHLYVLDLKRSYLHLREVLDVIKCLPNMTRFACRFIGYGQGLKKRRNKTIPDYLRSIYYPLSHRLKYWTMRYSPEAPINSVAITSVTIAVLCPSFISTDLTHNVDGYNKKLKELLASGLYDEHAEKISKLVYD
ncbi:hypothetical protein EV175_001247 [Coemansia sp. RSA 1933]|nr:hypothetical protein EV175_001247 [Coemansia sp. RSA 1933]